jgi:glycerophosphoryl diester phosphodiesterase
MNIIEQFTQSKSGRDDLNEDHIAITPDFIAVMDGVTSRAGATLAGMTTGRFAARVLGDALGVLPADIDAPSAVATLTAVLKEKAEVVANAENKTFEGLWSWPASALLVYSRARREIWRVADSSFMLDGVANMVTFPQELIWSDLRHAHIHALLARGMTEDDIRASDPTWELLAPLIGEFKIFANYDGDFGFGVINGAAVQTRHIEVFDASNAREIVMASDGYPEIFSTLDATEAHLKKLIADDPLLYKNIRMPKGVRAGHVSFDDRCYIRFTV